MSPARCSRSTKQRSAHSFGKRRCASLRGVNLCAPPLPCACLPQFSSSLSILSFKHHLAQAPLRCSYPCFTDLSSLEEEPYSEFGTECIRKHPHAEPVHHVSTMSNTHSHRRTSPPSSTERAHVREAKARRNQNLQMHSIARPTQPHAGAPRHACTQEAERQLA